jgi:hypothetical protein
VWREVNAPLCNGTLTSLEAMSVLLERAAGVIAAQHGAAPNPSPWMRPYARGGSSSWYSASECR